MHTQSFFNHNDYLETFYVGLTFRVLIFIALVIQPFYHSVFGFVGPLTYQIFADLAFYSDFGHKAFCWGSAYDYACNKEFISIYKSILKLDFENITNRYPGPIYPIILYITNYKADFTYILSFSVFFIEILSFFLWNKFLYTKVDKICAFMFCFLPIPLYFGFFHSTDIFFYFICSIIYLNSINFIKFKSSFFLLILLFLAVAIRPAGLSILFFSLTVSIFKKYDFKFKFSIIFLIILSIFYYSPYIIYEINVVTAAREYIISKSMLPAAGAVPIEIIIAQSFDLWQYTLKSFYKFFLVLGFVTTLIMEIFIFKKRSVLELFKIM